jgi:hypothetical protein
MRGGIILKGRPRILKYSCLRKDPDAKMMGSISFPSRGCSKTSVFGTASLDLMEKPGLCRFFQELVLKPTGFRNKPSIPGISLFANINPDLNVYG